MHWQPNQGTTLTSQVMAEACAVADSFPGVSRDGRWRSAMTFYRAVPREQSLPPPTDLPRDLLGISFHDFPNEYFFVMRSQRLIMRAQSSVQTVMDKLQSYKGRFFINFEV
jgi:mediator of RNA polymerase II transcription subunit 20